MAEPPTTAKVILQSTKGPIEIELWAKETPITSRNFIQNCISQKFNGCKFNKIIKDFIIQIDEPLKEESAFFKDEFHSRLRFNRRGILGSSNRNKPNSNNDQFFITLRETSELNNKFTVFGKVVGDTIYNVLKIADGELNGEEPLYPAVITKCEVIIKYFDDLDSEDSKKRKTNETITTKNKKKAKKIKVKLNYEDVEEEGNLDESVNLKMKSAHELLNDERLVVNKEVEDSKIIEDKENKEKAKVISPPVLEKSESKDNSSTIVSQKNANSNRRRHKLDKSALEAREQETIKMLSSFKDRMKNYDNHENNSENQSTKNNGAPSWLNNDDDNEEDLSSEEDNFEFYSHKLIDENPK